MAPPRPFLAEPQVLRLWNGFLNGRVLVAVVLLALQGLSLTVQNHIAPLLWAVCAVYLALTVFTRIAGRRTPPPPQVGWHWLPLIGVDIAVVCVLQLQQTSPMNYAPLLALPILMASALGTLLLAFATTASVTLLLLGWTGWNGRHGLTDLTQQYFQTALTCAGYFLMAYLTHQLAQRLQREQQLALQSRQAAHLQEQVNHLIIHHLDDGVLAIDRQGLVHTANPAALLLLDCAAGLQPPFALTASAGNAPLATLVEQTFASGAALTADMDLVHADHNPLGLHVRTWLTSPLDAAPLAGETLPAQWCVVFLHDLREMQARLRTEKLAAMGRMSAAVAHEIRNPLAAISQANALLAEDLSDPGQQRLSQMVAHNAQRLARIAEEVLDIARVQQQIHAAEASALPLDDQVEAIWQEWSAQGPAIGAPAGEAAARQGLVALQADQALVAFDAEHLRRVLVNLLDNAQRFRSAAADGLQLHTGHAGMAPLPGIAPPVGTQVWLQVWSDGAPLDASVQRHLFEPFFSSQSRSTGLGLYICRELCERYGARLGYQRLARTTTRGSVEGNAFTLVFYPTAVLGTPSYRLDTIVV
ncbi:ATP-binding protein [Pantoea sp. 18069]|uniref:ATP-binding protein n=1 Tax=Pantoea sp. 18069 TaxID=2681415 RepID=UPI00135CEDCE|nr:ATP-binding protein [Pantoea sp. 18069]